MAEQSGSPGNFNAHTYPTRAIRAMDKLGLVVVNNSNLTTNGEPFIQGFMYIPDTPLSRAVQIAESDMRDWLDTVIDDAQTIRYRQFAKQYPELGPYDERSKVNFAMGVLAITLTGIAIEGIQTLQETTSAALEAFQTFGYTIL